MTDWRQFHTWDDGKFWRRASSLGFEGLKRLAVISALAVAAQRSPFMINVFVLASVLFALPIAMTFQDWLFKPNYRPRPAPATLVAKGSRGNTIDSQYYYCCHLRGAQLCRSLYRA